jgi:CRISPR-associated protein Cmr5
VDGGMKMDNTITIKGLEQGRAKSAYDCALEGKSISKKVQIGTDWFKDDKYKSYVKKVPMLIKTNGLGSTFAFIKSKREKEKNRKKPGEKENPKNAYDLIYEQTRQWLKKDEKTLLIVNEDDDLVEKIISLDSPGYRAITNEVLAFFNWLTRFAEGLIEGEAENE